MLNRLREFREALGLSQAALAERVGVTRQCVIALEQGKWGPSLDLAYRLAGVLGQSVEMVFPPPGKESRGAGPRGRKGREGEDAALETWLL
ncbi:MAG: helix-turn-helix transcriptional regulator [Verrucomicrobiia bacterium]